MIFRKNFMKKLLDVRILTMYIIFLRGCNIRYVISWGKCYCRICSGYTLHLYHTTFKLKTHVCRTGTAERSDRIHQILLYALRRAHGRQKFCRQLLVFVRRPIARHVHRSTTLNQGRSVRHYSHYPRSVR